MADTANRAGSFNIKIDKTRDGFWHIESPDFPEVRAIKTDLNDALGQFVKTADEQAARLAEHGSEWPRERAENWLAARGHAVRSPA
jgi:hypothetical protein